MDILAEVNALVNPSDVDEPTVARQPGQGILVFSHALRLQYANHQALEIINGEATDDLGGEMLRIRLLELRDDIQGILDDRLSAEICAPFEVSRVVSEGRQRFLLRGFGYPKGLLSRDARIIVVLEEVPTDKRADLHLGIGASAMLERGVSAA